MSPTLSQTTASSNLLPRKTPSFFAFELKSVHITTTSSQTAFTLYKPRIIVRPTMKISIFCNLHEYSSHLPYQSSPPQCNQVNKFRKYAQKDQLIGDLLISMHSLTLTRSKLSKFDQLWINQIVGDLLISRHYLKLSFIRDF